MATPHEFMDKTSFNKVSDNMMKPGYQNMFRFVHGPADGGQSLNFI